MFIPSFACPSRRISTLLPRYSTGCVLALLIGIGSVAPGRAAQTVPARMIYTITDLGTLPGGYYLRGDGSKCYCSSGNSINTSGQVAGNAFTAATREVAALFSTGEVRDLGIVPGANSSAANGIAGYGRTTGSLQFFGTSILSYDHAFLYSAGKMKDIGTLPGDSSSDGNAINDSGQITGTSGTEAPPYLSHAFLYSAGTMKALGTFPSERASFGEAINASGQVAGAATPVGKTTLHAALFSGTSVKDLGTLADGDTSYAYGINDSGQITGLSFVGSGPYHHAFLYSKGAMTDLGTLPGDTQSIGLGINASAQVVGSSGGNRSFLYTPGEGMVDVASLLPAGSGWAQLNAAAINDLGQITGAGVNPDGYQHAFVVSPLRFILRTLDPVLELIGKPPTSFVIGGRFTLPANSSGINPTKETVVLQLSGYHIAIPPSSFVKINGTYTFNGKIGKVAVGMVIRPVAANAYLFGMEGVGAAALPKSYPVQMTLTIGSYTGTEEIKSGYNGPPMTPAELCKYFDLDCSE